MQAQTRPIYLILFTILTLSLLNVGVSEAQTGTYNEYMFQKYVAARQKLVFITRTQLRQTLARFDQKQQKILDKAKKKDRPFCRFHVLDVNMDGGVDPQDFVILRFCADWAPNSLLCIMADINGDGTVNGNDSAIWADTAHEWQEYCHFPPGVGPNQPTPTPTPVAAAPQ